MLIENARKNGNASGIRHTVQSTKKLEKKTLNNLMPTSRRGVCAEAQLLGNLMHQKKKTRAQPQLVLTKLMLVNLDDAVWPKAANNGTKSILQSADSISWVFAVWFKYTDSFSKAMKVPEAKEAAVTNWKIASLKRIPNKKQTRSNRGGTKKIATQVILVLLWTCVISKFQNLTINTRSTKARRTAWWCSEDDSGSHALFIEQGSSASHMTAAKVLDVISRLLGCAGKASDFFVSAYTGKNDDVRNCQDC